MKDLGLWVKDLLRSGPGTRLLLALFAVLVIAVVFIGLNDTPGYVVGYLASAVIFLVIVRRWRSIKNYVILFLATFSTGILLSGLYVEVISRVVVWVWGAGALNSLPMSIIETTISDLILFAAPMGLAFGVAGVLALGIRRILRPGKLADRTRLREQE